MRGDRRERGQAAFGVLVGLLIVAAVGGPLLLHVTQKRHNRLAFDLDAAYPPEAAVVNGEVFAATLAALVEHELAGTTGWRPNDFVLWGPDLWADNNANRQLGIIQAVRKATTIFKDHLTKVSSNEYDQNLVKAEAAFYNRMQKFWFPSAERMLQEGVQALHAYGRGLRATPPTSKPINARNTELIRLFQAATDLLGDAHANLFKDRDADGRRVRAWRTDDYFYHAQGMAHVLHHLMRALAREYAGELSKRPSLQTLFAEVADALEQAAALKPLIVLNGRPTSFFANHRRNLDGFIVEARQKMYSIREELEK
jgi:hypothetical protein